MWKELDMRHTLDGASARRTRPFRNRRRAGGCRRPGVECLEDRTLLTVAFQPVWGPETATDNGGSKMSSPPVYLLFWGSYWNSAQGKADSSSITSKAQALLGSQYFSGLTQYGSDGKASFGGTGFDYSNPSASFNDGDLRDEVDNFWGNGLPESDGVLPIYVVITQKGATDTNCPSAAGCHMLKDDNDWLVDDDQMPLAWVGLQGSVDSTTSVLSHELVESMSDLDPNSGINVTPGANWGKTGLPGGSEIGDNEPDGVRYTYRLGGPGGVKVQAYWSQQDGTYIVPDGNTQQVVLNPIWNGTSFTGTYTLTVVGDQAGHINDNLQISTSSTGGIQLTLNGEVFTFDKGRITAITVGLRGGTNFIDIEKTPAGVPTTVNLGNGKDLVFLSGLAANLNNIGGKVTLQGGDGKAQVIARDQAAPQPRSAYMDSQVLQGMGSLYLNYGNANLKDLVILGGQFGNSYTVADTPSTPVVSTRTILYSGAGADSVYVAATHGPLNIDGVDGMDRVFIGSSLTGSAPDTQGILAPVNVTETGDGLTDLTVNDSGDHFPRTTVLANGFMDGLAPATISWDVNAIHSLTVEGSAGGNHSTVIDPGPFPTRLDGGIGQNQVNFQAVSGLLTVDGNGSFADSVLIGWPVAGGHVLDHILAPVEVMNTGGFTSLTVDDSADTAAHPAAFLNSFALDFLAPQSIGFVSGEVTRLAILGGLGDDTLTVATPPIVLTTFDGGGGTNTLVGPNLDSDWQITGPDSGQLELLSFLEIQNLISGGGVNVFQIQNAGSLGGQIVGSGNDWLDYRAVSSYVTVNLANGTASAVAGGISNIRNVRAGSGGITLTGNAQGNILVGGDGNDTLIAGSERSLLIGGKGADVLTGGPADDILIAGFTDYDNNFAVLQSIYDVWQTPASYSTRIQNLQNGNNVLVWVQTVHDDAAPDVLTGGPGTDWFFANLTGGVLDTLTDWDTTTEQVN
jgi:hypothetical protein